jgi:hypothetical protein
MSAKDLAANLNSERMAERALRSIATTMKAPRFSSKEPVRFGWVEYQLMISNAGSAEAFKADQTIADDLTVRPDSSARMRQTVLRSPRLVSKIDQLHWQAAGKPPFASSTDRAGQSSSRRLRAGAWSFAPQGRIRLTFKRVGKLPTNERAVAEELARALGAANQTPPPATLSLRQYGFLLATAPLSLATRRAILDAIRSLPGVHLCGRLFPRHSPLDDAFCVNGDPTSTEILVDRTTGVVKVISERLDKPSIFYPNAAAGDLVDSYTFS